MSVIQSGLSERAVREERDEVVGADEVDLRLEARPVGEGVDEVEERRDEEEHHEDGERGDQEPQRVVLPPAAAGRELLDPLGAGGALGESEGGGHDGLPFRVRGAGRAAGTPWSIRSRALRWPWRARRTAPAWSAATSTVVFVPWIMSPRFRYRSGFATASACIEPTESASDALTSSSACGTSPGVSTPSCSDTVDCALTKSS